ncbi:divergent polysaccharide deacetylase family protein [Sulfitobacter guttiformis]|uniref:Polysaccharide deacetylase 2 family uncharacterized protein YibQ n=1 Tax=Sulfitobacter guttiformis TaxID=74349 RepID=A0A420DN57_9RHOB|nr:divergent polysaccharide deacetylase family protein [Sulfitobacter guttiformis]KIN72910.1 YibQ protein [Sulfitobacter guttiformis KCTC 32187]RKE95599.1 polysaccharide deacetylase 2 family uncharacterized protein YibQ [Sulfitobacter guttiformis]
MARGIFGGIALGAVFSVGVAGVVSVLVPMEPRPAPQTGSADNVAAPRAVASQPFVNAPAAGEVTATQPQGSLRAPTPETLPKEPAAAALAPQTTADAPAPVAGGTIAQSSVTSPARNESVTSSTAPSALPPVAEGGSDVATVIPAAPPQPETGTVANLTEPRPLPQGVAARAAEDEPVLPNPQALAPMIPDDSQDTEVVAQAPQAIAPDTADTPTAGTAPEEEIFTQVDPAPEGAEAPLQTAQAARPRVLDVPGRPVGTLGGQVRSSVGTPANTLVTRSAQPDVEPVETVIIEAGGADDTRPISRNAQPFANPEGKPLMGIVLIDTGADLDAGGIGLPALSSFPYPVSFAVDMGLPDAADRAARFRSEGFDVLAMLDLPAGAQPSDAEVSLSVAIQEMPEIVGILEGTGEGLQGTREVADQVTRILQASGHGLVTQSKGLNSMPKLALKEGVPAAPVFRDFDSEGQQPRVIRRFLDQAAFKAGQEGGVIVLGRLRPETIEALLVWGLADRAGSVALAPVSAVLLGQ